ncbi:hypothetical protein OHA25_03085 [Nonomuraea sp. NBC_00507]|uniref:VOC family protein n=1 Tax=Nonomuraea sp. NBC_00507 TaxID=2976002 RepID=UPI002E19351D
MLPEGRARAAVDDTRAFRHLSADWLAEINRLTGRGATVKERFEAHAWMRDPEGNDFCVVDGNHGGSGLQHGGELT